MRSLYITRHGQDVDNSRGILNGHRDQPLTELGFSQARNLAANIKEAKLIFSNIYSSPLNRALTTAKTISEYIGGPTPQVLPSLIERDFGILTGKPMTEIPMYSTNILQADKVNYFLEAEGAETFPEMVERAKGILEHLNGIEDALIVAHGDIGKMLYTAFYDLNWKDVLLEFQFGNAELLYLSHDHKPTDPYKFKFEQFNT